MRNPLDLSSSLKRLSVGGQAILANTAWLLSDRLIRMGVGFFVGVWVARYLGPKDFGSYSYVLAYVSLFSVLASLGLDSIVIRNLVREPDKREELLGTAFFVKLASGVVMCSLAALTIGLINDQASIKLLVVIYSTSLIFQAFDSIDFWFQSQVQSKYTVYVKNFAFVVSACLKIVLIQHHASLVAFVLVGVFEIALGAAGLLVIYWFNRRDLRKWKVSVQCAVSLLRESWPLVLAGFAITVYTRIDQLMIAQIMSVSDAGIYSVAVRVSEVWYSIPIAIVGSAYPYIVESKKVGEKLYYRRLQKMFTYLIAMSYLVAVPMTLIAKPLISELFGPQYGAAAPVLSVHIWTGVFVSLGVARSTWTNTEGLTSFAFQSTALGALVNAGANLVLIPRFGLIGAAVATLGSQILAALVTTALFPQTRQIFIMQLKALFLLGFFTNEQKTSV